MIICSSRGQPHPKYKARTSHIAVWVRDLQSLVVTGDELHDGAERGPVDRDGARSRAGNRLRFWHRLSGGGNRLIID